MECHLGIADKRLDHIQIYVRSLPSENPYSIRSNASPTPQSNRPAPRSRFMLCDRDIGASCFADFEYAAINCRPQRARAVIFLLFFLTAAACYSLGAAWYFWLWLQLRKNDPFWIDRLLESSAVLVLATLFWPVVVPICYSELLQSEIRGHREASNE